MIEKLQAEILKAQDSLQEVKIIIGDSEFVWYYRYLTLLEKMRINQFAVKTIKTTNTDGTIDIKYEKQEDQIPIYTILEKALDENGKKIFSSTNPEHFKIVSNLPVGASSYVAYEMSRDIFGTMENKEEE